MHSRYTYKRTMSISFSCVRKSNMFCSFEREKKGHFKWNLNNQQVYFEYRKRKKNTRNKSIYANLNGRIACIGPKRLSLSGVYPVDFYQSIHNHVHEEFSALDCRFLFIQALELERACMCYSTYIRYGCFDFFWDCGMTPSKYT